VNLNRYALVALAATSTLFATRAAAQACVEVDTDRDTLSDQDRSASRSLLLQALEQNGEKVARGKNGGRCATTYTVSTVRLGNSVSTTVTGPQGTRTMSLRAIEDLPNAYDQIVRSLQSGRGISETSGAMTRENVTANQAAPRRAEADSLWYARLGGGAVLGGSGNTGPAFGCGYRYELDSVGIDLSFFNLTYASHKTTDEFGYTTNEPSLSGSWARLLGYYFVSPKESASLYFGGGLSWGGSSVLDGDYLYGGSGIQGELSAGFEVLRASTLRLFVQVDATLPFYKSDVDAAASLYPVGGLPDDTRYTPTVMVSIGGGFTRSNTIKVNLVP
jgi:hypothetical protein